MLIGAHKHSVDNKNRIFIPVRFRPELGHKCVLSRDIKYNCLRLYSADNWIKYTEKIEELPTVQMSRVRQMIYQNSEETKKAVIDELIEKGF